MQHTLNLLQTDKIYLQTLQIPLLIIQFLHPHCPTLQFQIQHINTSQVQPLVQFHTTTPTSQPMLQTQTYTSAQITQAQNIHPGLTNITLQNYTTCQNLSRPPLQTIPTNPLSY